MEKSSPASLKAILKNQTECHAQLVCGDASHKEDVLPNNGVHLVESLEQHPFQPAKITLDSSTTKVPSLAEFVNNLQDNGVGLNQPIRDMLAVSSSSVNLPKFLIENEPSLPASNVQNYSTKLHMLELPQLDDVPVKTLEDEEEVDEGYLSLCRICANSHAKLIPLFHGEGQVLGLVDKIHRCLPIKVEDNDKFPHQICDDCALKLQICDHLRETSICGDAKLKAIQNTTTNPDELHKFSDVNSCKKQIKMSLNENKMKISQSLVKQVKEIETFKCEPGNDLSKDSQALSSVIDFVYSLPAPSNNALKQHALAEDREWDCNECTYRASRKSSLVLHKRYKHNAELKTAKGERKNDRKYENLLNVFLCDFCDKSFQSDTKRIKHMQSHTRLAMRQSVELCSFCSEEFLNSRSLQKHVRTVHNMEEPQKYNCDKCEKSFQLPGSLNIHRATHSKETPFLCDICGKSFKHASNLRCHKRSHAEFKLTHRHLCDICPKSFSSRFHLSEHKNVHLNITPYSCAVCDKRFHRRIQLRQHKVIHNSDSSYECPQCGVCFNRRGNMTQHMKRHLKERKFICKVCKESFQSLSEVVQHRRKHTQEDCGESVLSCIHCQDSFSSTDKLKEHLKTHSETKFQCEFCQKHLSNRRTLEYHVRSFHTGERPFPCQFCSESFLSRETRLVHERLHTGEKPYTCQVCKMSFRCSSNLTQHTLTHREDRPWSCHHCPKRFKRKGILIVHMRTHTGEKPFCCDICGRRFTQKNDMLKHQQTHKTTKQTYVCSGCNWSFSSRKELNKHSQVHQNIVGIETISANNATHLMQSQPQALVITDDLCQYPITILEDRSNVIVHQLEDIQKHSQIIGVNTGEQNQQIVHFADSLFHAVVTEPQFVQVEATKNQLEHYDVETRVSVLSSPADNLML